MRRCLIVGGNSSIGTEIDGIFSKNGYEVIKTTRRKTPVDNTSALYVDFSSCSCGDQLAKKVGFIDVVIFCTGHLPGKDLLNYSNEDFNDVVESNILQVFRTLKVVLPLLNERASVIFIGSISGSAGSFDEVYAASKASLVGLTKSLAVKSEKKIRFNCLAPGLIEGSTMGKKLTVAQVAKHKKQTPTGELLQLNQVAKICFDLCEPHWSSLNGQIINVNGGRYV